jgi:hypothetical protein
LWLELVIRSAAVAATTLFVPLAFAGLIWPSTTRLVRRFGELIVGLVLSKLVICGVLALASLSIVGEDGVGGTVQGIGLLLLATCSPFTLLRLVPAVELGAFEHLGGLGRGALRAARNVTGNLSSLNEEQPSVEMIPGTDVEFARGTTFSGPAFDGLVADIERSIKANDIRTSDAARSEPSEDSGDE